MARKEKSKIQSCFLLLLLLGIGALISFSALKKRQSCHHSDKIQTVCYTSNYQSAFWVKWYNSIIVFCSLVSYKKKLSLLSNQLKEQKFCKLLPHCSYFRPNTSLVSVRNYTTLYCLQVVFNVAVSMTCFTLCNFTEMISFVTLLYAAHFDTSH